MAVAENSQLDFVSFNADAEGKLEKLDGQGLMITEIMLRPRLTVADAADPERAARILAKAEKLCLILNS